MNIDETTHEVTEALDRLDSREPDDVCMTLLQAVERMGVRLAQRRTHPGSGWRDAVRRELAKRCAPRL